MPLVPADAEQLYVRDRAEWRSWLEAHATTSGAVWLVYDKGPGRRLSYDDIVEEALCFGWVDSRPRRLDETRSMLWLAPRTPTSSWSRRNKERVARLRGAGLMTSAGEAVIAAAEANGAWTALDEVEELTEPDDLRAALAAVPAARDCWATFPRSARRAILEWLASARKPETRAARVRTIVDEAAVGRRANQWRQPGGR